MTRLAVALRALVAPNWLLLRTRLVATQLGPGMNRPPGRSRALRVVQHAPLDDVFIPTWLVLALPLAGVGALLRDVAGGGVLAVLLAYPVAHLAAWLIGERVTGFAGERALVDGEDPGRIWRALRVHTLLGWLGTASLAIFLLGST